MLRHRGSRGKDKRSKQQTQSTLTNAVSWLNLKFAPGPHKQAQNKITAGVPRVRPWLAREATHTSVSHPPPRLNNEAQKNNAHHRRDAMPGMLSSSASSSGRALHCDTEHQFARPNAQFEMHASLACPISATLHTWLSSLPAAPRAGNRSRSEKGFSRDLLRS